MPVLLYRMYTSQYPESYNSHSAPLWCCSPSAPVEICDSIVFKASHFYNTQNENHFQDSVKSGYMNKSINKSSTSDFSIERRYLQLYFFYLNLYNGTFCNIKKEDDFPCKLLNSLSKYYFINNEALEGTMALKYTPCSASPFQKDSNRHTKFWGSGPLGIDQV